MKQEGTIFGICFFCDKPCHQKTWAHHKCIINKIRKYDKMIVSKINNMITPKSIYRMKNIQFTHKY